MKDKSVFFTANTFFALYNFRSNLIERFVKSGYTVILCAQSDGYEKKFSSDSVTVLSLNTQCNKGIRYIRLAMYIWMSIIKYKPHYIFSFTLLNNLCVGMISKIQNFYFVPNVTGLGRTWNTSLSRHIFAKIYRFLFSDAAQILVQNERDKDVFTGLFRHSSHVIKVNGSGVNITQFQKLNRQYEKKAIRIAMISRIVREKGYEIYLEAMSEIKRKYKNAVVVDFVTGYDSDTSKILKLEERYPSVNFLPFTDDIATYLTHVDLSVLPSRYNEGTPRILIESIAAGCSVITSNQPGCIETVKNKKNGLILKSVSHSDLVFAVEEYLELPVAIKKQWSAESVKLSREKYNEEDIIQLYMSFLES